MDVNTPALLFGSISLFLLAFSNRFLVIAKLIRELHEESLKREKEMVKMQLVILRKRVQFIKYTQTFGVLSFILCTGSLFALFLQNELAGKLFFSISVLSLLLSLAFGLREIFESTKALDILLDNTLTRKSKK